MTARRKTVKTLADQIRSHADVLFNIPTGEQFMGQRDSVLTAALLDIAACLELLDQKARRPAGKE